MRLQELFSTYRQAAACGHTRHEPTTSIARAQMTTEMVRSHFFMGSFSRSWILMRWFAPSLRHPFGGFFFL